MGLTIDLSLIILLSTFVSIGCQSESPHLCEALESNENRIDYSFSQPDWTQKIFYNKISIRGYVWSLEYMHRNKREDSEDSEKSDNSENGAEVNTQAQGSAVVHSGEVKLRSERGQRMVENTNFFNSPYSAAFSVRYYNNKEKILVGGLSLDFRQIIWIVLQRQRKTGARIRRQLATDTTPDIRWIYNFATGFDGIDFRPQVSFNTMANIDKSIVTFVESKAGDEKGDQKGRFQSIIQTYQLNTGEGSWSNITAGESSKVPPSVRIVSTYYLIKGVFPILLGTKNGFIILVEVCSTEDIPCSGSKVYKYCVVDDKISDVTEEGKPCNQNSLRLLFDCEKWQINFGKLDQTSPLVVEANEEETPNITSTPEDETTTEEETTTLSTTEKPKEGGMWWLWILILIILIILAILLCLFCCLKKKGKEEKEPKPPVPPVDAGGKAESKVEKTESSLESTESTRSNFDKSGSNKSGSGTGHSGHSGHSGGSGGSHSKLSASSSLSTTSNRSKFDGKASKVEPKSSSTKNMPSTVTSKVSTRSKIK